MIAFMPPCPLVIALVPDDPIAHQIEDAIKKSTQNTTITSSKPSKSSSKSKSSKSKSKARDKCRSAQQQSAHARRYAVITSLRGIDLNELDTESKNPTPKKTAPVKRTPSKLKIWNRLSKEKKAAAAAAETADEEMAKKLFCLYDVVQEDAPATATTNGQSQAKTADKKGAANPDVILCNSVQMIREKLVIDDKSPETDYVYDLYYIEEGPVDLNAATIGMHTGPDQELIYEHFVEQEQFEMYEDDSDSNEEGNWRNDYPEDEPDKRHPDLFDELIDDYCYGDQSSDDDFGEYSDYKKRPGRNMLNYNDDDLDCYS
ncbi:probable RNA polymerase II nuclear localization protein SLC7A6OS [Asterias rubens]|uniref:probable RNA polymerase II nuclear localization protein SLC7A6OS n=1 Tax=Asterias rubens TaxID=7604 RepID=UPI0014555A62|nr:probable RNA polymerase II nuclear localization protein SLC7A6OS [Asterias rubens]